MQRIKEINFAKEGRQLLRDYALLALGTFLAALSLPLFFLPYDIAPGGISGISTVLSSVLPLSVGLLSFALNVPLFLVGWRTVGWRFAVRSFIAMTLMSLFIDLVPVRDVSGNVMLAAVFGGVLLGWRTVGWRFAVRSFIAMTLMSLFIDLVPVSDVSGNVLLAAVFGGVLMGVGLGLVVRAGATTGGTDMAAKMIHSRIGFLPIATILFMIDGLVVAAAGLRFGLQAALWALIALYVSSMAMDTVIKGFNTAMQFMIISNDSEEIVKRIHRDIDRGCTRLMAEGTYSQKPVGALLCVVSRTEAPRLKKIVAEVDPDAFVTVCNVHEALGEGFTGIGEQ